MKLEDFEFKTLKGKLIDNPIEYLNDKIKDDTKVLVGCDSQNSGKKSIYGLVIALHYGNKGAHVIYTKLEFDRFKDSFSKLWKEVELSIVLAESLKNNKIKKINFLDLDLNPDPLYNSNKILSSAIGWCNALGYEVRVKPDSLVASYMADRICRKVKYKIKKNKIKIKEKAF